MSPSTRSSAARVRELQRALDQERAARRRLEKRCRALQAAAQIGGAAGDIAHQLRNPLFSIEGFAELLQRRHADDPKVEHWVRRIVEGVSGANRVLATVVDLSRPESLDPEPVTGAEIADAALAVLRAEYPPDELGWTLRRGGDPGIVVSVDTTLAKEALLHLLRNGVEAGATRLDLSCRAPAPDAIEIALEDDGEGIDPGRLERVRRLFYTTRPGADGIGLGRGAKQFGYLRIAIGVGLFRKRQIFPVRLTLSCKSIL